MPEDLPDGATPETKGSLELAIHNHFPEMMVTSYVVLVSGLPKDGEGYGSRTSYDQDHPEGQPFHTTVGLLQVGVWAAQEYWNSDDTDGD